MTQGIGGPSYPGSPPQSIRWLPFRNDAGETIPPFACMRVTGATTANGQRVYTVAKPNGSGTVHMINGPTQVTVAQLYGSGTFDMPATAFYNSGSGTPAFEEFWGPKSGQWSLEKGYSGYRIIGDNLGSGSTARTVVDRIDPYARFIASITGTEHTCTTSGTVSTGELENTSTAAFQFASSILTLPNPGRYMFYLSSTIFANTAGNWNASAGWLRNGGEWVGGIGTFYGNATVVGTPFTLAVPLYDHTPGDNYRLWMSQGGATSVIMFGDTPGGGGAGQAMRWTVERRS